MKTTVYVIGSAIPLTYEDKWTNDYIMRTHEPLERDGWNVKYIRLILSGLTRKKKNKNTIVSGSSRSDVIVTKQYYASRPYLFKVCASFVTFVKLSKVLRKQKINNHDVIHCYGLYPSCFAGYLAKQIFGCKLLMNIRYEEKELQRNKYGLMRRLVGSADSIVTPSYHIKNIIDIKYKASSTVIPHGVDPPTGKREIVEGNIIDIVTVSRFTKVKRMIEHVLLFGELINEYDDIRYTVIGDGEDFEPAYRIVKERSYRIIMKGWQSQEEIYKSYRRAQLFVLISQQETFGRVYLEALTHGLYVACTTRSGFYDQLYWHNRVVGMEQLSKIKIIKLIERIRSEPSISRYDYDIMQKYSWSSVGRQYTDVVNGLNNRGSR